MKKLILTKFFIKGAAIEPNLPTTEVDPIPMCRITVGNSSGPYKKRTTQALLPANFPSNAKVTLKAVVFEGMTAIVDTVVKNMKNEYSFLLPIYLSPNTVIKFDGNSTSPERKKVM
jgi:hypothetical protein